MTYKGIIFDFNGTLYWDSAKHKQAWREFSKIIRGTEFSDEEMVHHMFGRTNEEILEYALGHKPAPEIVEKYGQEKEALYRQRALNDSENFHLAKGAVEFLDFLKMRNRNSAVRDVPAEKRAEFDELVKLYLKELNAAKQADKQTIVTEDK